MNESLLQQIYKQYQRELYLYLYGLCRNRTVAEDLMQDTFLKAFLTLQDGHPNFRAWLYMVARNLFFDYMRKESHMTEFSENQIPSDDEPVERLIADEMRSALYQAIGNLDSRKREVLLLQYFSKLPQKEIAVILRIKPEYVRVLSSRAKRELKRQMEALGYDV